MEHYTNEDENGNSLSRVTEIELEFEWDFDESNCQLTVAVSDFHLIQDWSVCAPAHLPNFKEWSTFWT